VYNTFERRQFQNTTRERRDDYTDTATILYKQDIVWLHVPSKTLIEADALFNLPCDAQKSGLFASIFPDFLLRQMSPNTGFHRMVTKAFSKPNPNAFAESARIIDGWDFDKLIPCHGEAITLSTPSPPGSTMNAAKAAWRNAYASVMEQNNKTK
jgi:hypothetical protein